MSPKRVPEWPPGRPAGGPICLIGVEKRGRWPPGGGAIGVPKRDPEMAHPGSRNCPKRGPGMVPFRDQKWTRE